MAPLIVQLVCWVLAWLAGMTGLVPKFATPVEALRIAFATMFVFTALAHFVPPTRSEMVSMVPPALPKPAWLVTATGVLELAGAFGLMIPAVGKVAAVALAVLLVAMFPANMYAASSGVVVAGRRAMAIAPRLALQLFWIAGLGWVAVAS